MKPPEFTSGGEGALRKPPDKEQLDRDRRLRWIEGQCAISIELRGDFGAPSEVRAPKSPPSHPSELVPSFLSGPRFE